MANGVNKPSPVLTIEIIWLYSSLRSATSRRRRSSYAPIRPTRPVWGVAGLGGVGPKPPGRGGMSPYCGGIATAGLLRSPLCCDTDVRESWHRRQRVVTQTSESRDPPMLCHVVGETQANSTAWTTTARRRLSLIAIAGRRRTRVELQK